MSIVYQLTFFLALGLLAIVVTVFVFAVSQVGRATESASREQQGILSIQTRAKKRQIDRIQKQLKEMKSFGELDARRLIDELKETQDEITRYETQLKHIQRRTISIKRKGAVVYPGIAFFLVLVLALAASGLTEAQYHPALALCLWIISLGFLVFGIDRLFITLGAIEEVTIASEESIEKLPEAVKRALIELEEEKKPVVELEFIDEQPPFIMEVNKQKQLIFGLVVIKGDVAHKPQVAFLAPKGFEFPGGNTSVQPDDVEIVAGYITTYFNFSDCHRAIRSMRAFIIKAPPEAGTYTLFYIVSSEGFDSYLQEFVVTVEGPDISF